MSNENNHKDSSGGAAKMALDKAFALHAWEPEFKSPECVWQHTPVTQHGGRDISKAGQAG